MSFCTYTLARLKELEAVYKKYEAHVSQFPGQNVFNINFSLAELLGVKLSDLEAAVNQATLGFGVEESSENQWIKVGTFIGSISKQQRFCVQTIKKKQKELLAQFSQGLITEDELFVTSFNVVFYNGADLYKNYSTSLAESGIVNQDCRIYINEWLMKDSSSE